MALFCFCNALICCLSYLVDSGARFAVVGTEDSEVCCWLGPWRRSDSDLRVWYMDISWKVEFPVICCLEKPCVLCENFSGLLQGCAYFVMERVIWSAENLVCEDGLSGIVPKLERDDVSLSLACLGVGPGRNPQNGAYGTVLEGL